MRYQNKSAISYMFRNFWRLVPIALPFGIVTGVFCNFVCEADFVAKLFRGSMTLEGFLGEFTKSFTLVRYGVHWYLPIIVVLLMALTESVFVVKISRHMRVGELSVVSPKNVLTIFPTMLLYVAVMFLAKSVLDFLPVGVVLMMKSVNRVSILASVALVVTFLLSLFVSFVFGLLLCAFPFKYCDNYSFNSALSCSSRYTSGDRKYIWLFTMLYPCTRLVVNLVTILTGSGIVGMVLQVLYFTFFAVYVPCLAFVKYYEYVGRERRDIGQVMFG